jgi:hypothetical protein
VGELTHLIPLPARAEGSLLLALLTLPLYSMLAVVAVVERAGEVYRRPAGAVALLGRAVVALISLAAALFTLAAIFTSAGRYFAP